MGYILLRLFVLKTIIATALSFPNAVGTVTPIKPRPLLPSSVPEVLPTIQSLECDGEDILSPFFSSLGVSREFSSPLALTTSSKPLPVPKIDNLSISNVKIPEGCEDTLPAPLKALLKGTSVAERSDVCSTEIFFPFKRLVKNAIKIPKLYENSPECVIPRCEDMCLSPSFEVSIQTNPFLSQSSKCSPNTFVPNSMSVPNIKSPPVGLQDSLKRNPISKFANNALSTVSSPLSSSTPKPTICSSHTVSEPYSELPTSSKPTHLGSLPYPLSYQSKFLPRVRTPEFRFRNCRPYLRNENILNSPNSQNLFSPTPTLSTSHINSINEGNPYLDLTCLPQEPIKPTCEPVPPCVSPITLTERPNFFNQVQIPKITPPLSMEPRFCPTRVENSWQYKNPFIPSIGCENLCLPNSCKTLNTVSSDNILPILDSIPFVTVNDISYSYPNGLPAVTPKRLCESTLILPSDVYCSNTPFTSTPTPCLTENHPKIQPKPKVSLDESHNCKNNFDGHICSSDFSIPNMFPTVDAFVASLNNVKGVNIPDVCTTSRTTDICSCTTSVPPVIPTNNNCCSKIYSSSVSPTSSYINISPACPISKSSAKMVSSINDMVANITQNLLCSYISCLNAEPKPICKIPKGPPKYNTNLPDLRPKVTQIRSALPPVNLSYKKSPVPVIYSANTNTCPQTDCPIIIQLDSLYPSNTPSSEIPPLISYASPFSTSYLPSPTLPYTSPPFYPEPPVLKISPSKKRDKDRVLELMILAELLDGDDYYEWDELDTLLALLAIS